MKKLLVALAAVCLASTAAHATPIVGASSITNFGTNYTFDGQALSTGAALPPGQFPGLTITSVGGGVVTYDTVGQFTNGTGTFSADNIGFNNGAIGVGMQIAFGRTLQNVNFAQDNGGNPYTLTLLNGGFTTGTINFTGANSSNPNDVFGSTGVAFDTIQITADNGINLIIDNLSIGSAVGAPEIDSTSAAAPLFFALGALGIVSGRRRKLA